jgi:hypothetical protein
MSDSIFERTIHANRLFSDGEAPARLGEGLLARTLPRADWTHEGHIAATLWLIRARADLDLPAALPVIISRYNESVGGVNSDEAGYHHTLTLFYLALLQAFSARHGNDNDLLALVNLALMRPFAARDYPQHHYSDGLLWSVAARRDWCAPDLVPLDQALL